MQLHGVAELYTVSRVDEATTSSDIDGDGNATDVLALSTQTSGLQGSAGLTVLKEICQPDATQSDG